MRSLLNLSPAAKRVQWISLSFKPSNGKPNRMSLQENTLSKIASRYSPAIFCAVLLLVGLCHFHGWAGSDFWDRLPGDRGDGRFIPFCLEHEYQSIRGNGSFVSPPFFYPAQGTLGYSDVLLGFLPIYSFFRLIGVEPFGSMQGSLWAADLLAFFLALGFLRRGIGFGLIPSALGAAFFAFNNPRFQMTNHYQIQAGFILPAAAWLIASSLRNPKASGTGLDLRWAGALLLIDVQLLTSYYLGWFALAWGFLFLFGMALDPETREGLCEYVHRQRRSLSVAVAAFVLGMIPFLLIYLPAFATQAPRKYDDYLSLMPTWGSWFWMGASHPLEKSWAPLLGMDSGLCLEPELRMSWGWMVWLVLGLALWVFLRDLRKGESDENKPSCHWVAPWAATLVLGLMVVHWGEFSLWRFVFQYVPGASSIRGVGRIAVFMTLPVAVALAWSCQRFGIWAAGLSVSKRRWFIVGAVVFGCMTVAEQFSPPPGPGYSASKESARLTQLAAGIPKNCEAFYIGLPPTAPGSSAEWSLDAAWAAQESGVPTLHGYSGTEPPGWNLGGLKRPDFQARVQEWVQRNHLRGPVCEIQPMGFSFENKVQ